jgi:hypothetical protein
MKRLLVMAALSLSLVALGAPAGHASSVAPTASCNAGTMNAHTRVPETTGAGAPIGAHEHIPESTEGGCVHEAFAG